MKWFTPKKKSKQQKTHIWNTKWFTNLREEELHRYRIPVIHFQIIIPRIIIWCVEHLCNWSIPYFKFRIIEIGITLLSISHHTLWLNDSKWRVLAVFLFSLLLSLTIIDNSILQWMRSETVRIQNLSEEKKKKRKNEIILKEKKQCIKIFKKELIKD